MTHVYSSRLVVSLFCALLLWSVVALSTLALTKPAPHKTTHTKANYQPSEQVRVLLAAHEKEPHSLEATLALASAYVDDGSRAGVAEPFIEALRLYRQVLESEPKNTTALRAIGEISLDLGLAEAAALSFENYLQVQPGDIDIEISLALAELQQNKPEPSTQRLVSVLERQPKNFRARLSLALAYRLLNNIPAATDAAKNAVDIAPDATARKVALSLLDQLGAANTTPSQSAVNEERPQTLHARVESFVRNHPILGPKFLRIDWTQSSCRVYLEHFPIAQMPPVAKSRLEEKFVPLFVGSAIKTVSISDIAAPDEELRFSVADK